MLPFFKNCASKIANNLLQVGLSAKTTKLIQICFEKKKKMFECLDKFFFKDFHGKRRKNLPHLLNDPSH